MNQLRDVYLRTVRADRSLKQRTKEYAVQALTAAWKVWPEVESRDVASITALECLDWFSRLNYSASRYNGILQRVRSMFTVAVQLGLRAENPMAMVKSCPVRIKPPKLPTFEQFKQIIAYLERSPESRRAVRLVKFLAYSGLRIGEALKLTWADITPYGIRVSDAKNGDDAFVPILPEMEELLKTIPKDRPLFRVKNPRKALGNACRSVGVAPLTNHQLRHLFATRALECGVDVKTVAEWLRHKDGGALALKRYSHVRAEHSQAMALKVSFLKSLPEHRNKIITDDSTVRPEPVWELRTAQIQDPEPEPAQESRKILRVVRDYRKNW
jgi:integrase